MTFKKYTIVYRVKPIKKEIEILRKTNRHKSSDTTKHKNAINYLTAIYGSIESLCLQRSNTN